MMIGGPEATVRHLDPVFKTLAPGAGDILRTPGREKIGGTAELRLPALRSERRRSLRQDGP
jgi:6-phosphogluconate dehydrogenase